MWIRLLQISVGVELTPAGPNVCPGMLMYFKYN